MARRMDIAPAKLNLALHLRGRLADGRHAIETLFAFCIDGDRLWAQPGKGLSMEVGGPFGGAVSGPNLVEVAAAALAEAAGVPADAHIALEKNLPVAAGIGGGSADAAAALRLLTALWAIDPSHAASVAPALGADVPACLLSLAARGTGAGDALELVADASIPGTPVLLVNPGTSLATRDVFARWDGVDRGPLGAWREGRNDLEKPATALVPAIGDILDWLRERQGAGVIRMSGSGATCFAVFDTIEARDAAASAVPAHWWHLATSLR